MDPSKVSAVLVTRGNVDLAPILETLPFSDVVIWDNSRREDCSVYGRYLAMAEAKHDVIYTQDDDCLVDVAAVIAEYEPGVVTCNMPQNRRPEYPKCALVGWGSVFNKVEAAWAHMRYLAAGGEIDELYRNECDRWFTAVNFRKLIDVPFEHLPHAHGEDRMGRRRNHLKDRARILDRVHKHLHGHSLSLA